MTRTETKSNSDLIMHIRQSLSEYIFSSIIAAAYIFVWQSVISFIPFLNFPIQKLETYALLWSLTSFTIYLLMRRQIFRTSFWSAMVLLFFLTSILSVGVMYLLF